MIELISGILAVLLGSAIGILVSKVIDYFFGGIRMSENRENWLYPEASGLYFPHDGFIMRATDGKQYDYYEECDLLNKLTEENEQLKKELRVYRKIASCHNCHYHSYDWNIDDGYGGEEYEVCDKGNDVTEGICEDWEEL